MIGGGRGAETTPRFSHTTGKPAALLAARHRVSEASNRGQVEPEVGGSVVI